MTSSKIVLTLATVVASWLVGLCASASAALPPLSHLRAGERADLHQRVPVQVVFVGLEQGSGPTRIDDTQDLWGSQVPSSRVINRVAHAAERAGSTKRVASSTVGMTYDYDYRAVFADRAFEDAYFSYLDSIAIGPLAPTVYQQAYSADPRAAQHITNNSLIDATKAESWLAAHAGPMLGVDTTRPTVFFVNWFGRPDFRFHTYAFLGQRPGTSYPLGFTQAGQMVAWGGTPAQSPYGGSGRESRVWFYDFSAGPDYRTANWLLGPRDIDGDGYTDGRIPPIWEYGTTHWYEPFDSLEGAALGLLRYVAVDCLFGTNPLYDPALSAPLLSDRVELDANVFAGDPRHDPLSSLDLQGASRAFGRLDPTRTFPVDVSVQPLDGNVAKQFDCNEASYGGDGHPCNGHVNATGTFGASNALDPFFQTHANQFLDGTRYELPLAIFDVPFERLAPHHPYIGEADGGRVAGQSGWAYFWLNDRLRATGSWTDTGIVSHEAGHLLGLPHPHDGYDPLQDYEFRGTGGWWYVWAGDESYTNMSYVPNTADFSQFDRDNIARWNVAARIDSANRILQDIAASPRSDKASAKLSAADVKAGDAETAMAAWNLPAASQAADDAYQLVLGAAADANVKVEPFSGVADERNGAGGLRAATDPGADAAAPQPPGSDATARYGPTGGI